MKDGMKILVILAVASVFIGTIQIQPNSLQKQFEDEHSKIVSTSARNASCDPHINVSLETTTFTPDRKIPLEIGLSCMDYQSIYDDDGNGIMDFDLQVKLFKNGAAGSEQIWFANQNSKVCVGSSCIFWNFNLNSTDFVEVFYLNGAINNDAETDDDLWPPRNNNLTPNHTYTAVVTLGSMNQYFSMSRNITFTVVPPTNPEECTPLLKTFTTNSPASTATEPLETGDFYRFTDIMYNHLDLTCLDEDDGYHVMWRITEWHSGDELDSGWWNVTGEIETQTTITRLASSIHVIDGSMKYAISGSAFSDSGTQIKYYPNQGSSYSYGGFWINISDMDDDFIEDPNDNCMYVQNPYQLDLDSDQTGDVCDEDMDGDGVENSMPFNGSGQDKCPYQDASENDEDLDGCIDEIVLEDSDNDSIPNVYDSYPYTPYTDDFDNDSVVNTGDNCPYISNLEQTNMDNDDFGDACDFDIDGDGVNNSIPVVLSNSSNFDLCPYTTVNSSRDSNMDGCPDDSEPQVVECPACDQSEAVADEPIDSETNDTAILDPEDIPTAAAIGGAGAFGGGLAAVGIRKLRQGARYIGVDDGLDMLKHLPKRKKADSGSDHYFQKGRIRQQEMTKSADKLLDDYIEDGDVKKIPDNDSKSKSRKKRKKEVLK